jgi:hypothetical protein
VVPMGIAHTFRVDSETARVLVLSTPADATPKACCVSNSGHAGLHDVLDALACVMTADHSDA